MMRSLRRVAQSTLASEQWKVLFCGLEMRSGFLFTREALQDREDIKVECCSHEEIQEAIQNADVAVPLMARIDRSIIERAARLKMILQYGVGVEGVDIAAATQHRVWVSNIPSHGTGNALSCAEHAIFLILSLLRDTKEMARSLQSKTLGWPAGDTLYGKSVLVLGFGNIAQALVPRLKPFGCRISCVTRRLRDRETLDNAGRAFAAASHQLHADHIFIRIAFDMLDGLGTMQQLPQMVPDADIVVVACSQTEETRGLVNAELLARCRPGVRIVNVARGGLLDHDSTMAALESGRIGGLGLDVQWTEPFPPEHPLMSHPRAVLTPHIAGVTQLSYRHMAQVVAEEVARLKQGQEPSVQLNRPHEPSLSQNGSPAQ